MSTITAVQYEECRVKARDIGAAWINKRPIGRTRAHITDMFHFAMFIYLNEAKAASKPGPEPDLGGAT